MRSSIFGTCVNLLESVIRHACFVGGLCMRCHHDDRSDDYHVGCWILNMLLLA